MSHTYVELEISAEAWDEIAAKLREAGYDHAFDRPDLIDMHGIAVIRGAATPAPLAPDVETLARALWALLIEDALERDGQEGCPAFSTYADRTDVDEPCAFDEQSEDLREWARWRANRLLMLAGVLDAMQYSGVLPTRFQS